MKWLKTLLFTFAALFAAGIISVIPPVQMLIESVEVNQTPWLLATGSAALLGFVLMMGGILDLLISQDQPIRHADAEDVARSVRMAPMPTTWRTTSYRIWGTVTGREGSDTFTFREMKEAWNRGAWRREPVWRRRYLTATGAFLLMVGVFGIGVTLGPPPIKILLGGALLYASVRLGLGMWKA